MIDDTDIRLLASLQTDATLTAEALGARINLSPSQAARRRARLEAAGIVTGYGARIDPGRVGLTVQAFVRVIMASHDPDAARSFATLLRSTPEVVEAWTLTGESDYLLRLFCADLPALNGLVQDVLLPHPAVARVQSQIVMEELKAGRHLPL